MSKENGKSALRPLHQQLEHSLFKHTQNTAKGDHTLGYKPGGKTKIYNLKRIPKNLDLKQILGRHLSKITYKECQDTG